MKCEINYRECTLASDRISPEQFIFFFQFKLLDLNQNFSFNLSGLIISDLNKLKLK